ncbi:D-alanyl-D-alanine carboxypeptidase/D-alanyl-D-alanine endopeptidase [Frondihabitans australicus]|uniref:D-alanyl-D-alanine carboxypeptidase/D-alanyl-D-alanine-endopeptidase (Penicillin-binding protein 4) n=1 Tax=Frondihabitans australicus TaxID=386892 RepID=A0A495ICY9_9MICO|nr:D-alanyl-D-alanine carboxypeptidase/D-alanyl-D-alanine-endopeptidase [Frondihabitans australicus]RKR73171.1 D-alanyl-D-alanine carboxypeptidase/D-alanyl-D-alanine-endopeptidase (penicillin-binding protein 4) [Frondihabitans australicus]
MTSDDSSSAGGFGRVGAWVRTHKSTSLILAGAVAVVLFGGGALAAGAATAPSSSTAGGPQGAGGGGASSAPSPTASKTPAAPARPVPTTLPGATTLRTCSVDSQAAAAGLGTFQGTVVNSSTGQTLFDRNGSTPVATASVMKTLTASVALAVLGPDYRFTTTVNGSGAGGTISLIGGGDATLSATPVGSESYYKGAPKLATLAADVKAKLGSNAITTIDLDSTYWNNADAYDSTWPVTERTIGYQPEVVPLMVDGDRADPTQQTSPRSTDPVMRAGQAFQQALVAAGVNGASTAKLVQAKNTSHNTLAKVQSQPISTLIGQMIPNSDNTLAEMMARVSSKVSGADGSAASLTDVYKKVLNKTYGLDTSKLTIIDGSGESYKDGVPSSFEAALMTLVLGRNANLGILYDALPISGQTGTLATRFTGANAIARGQVHAKTGSIATAYTLAGVIDAKDGTKLTFAFFAEGNLNAATSMQALDTLTTAVYSCGANLSNN